MTRLEEFDRERKRILWRLRLLTWGLWGGAVAMAVGGGALVAWVLSLGGLPFLRTWLIVSVILLAVPVMIHLAVRRDHDESGPGQEQ